MGAPYVEPLDPLYVAEKSNRIDTELGYYINDNPETFKDKIIFEREKEHDDVYLFGNKKISMKLKGDQLEVRVGGEYITIEDFVE